MTEHTGGWDAAVQIAQIIATAVVGFLALQTKQIITDHAKTQKTTADDIQKTGNETHKIVNSRFEAMAATIEELKKDLLSARQENTQFKVVTITIEELKRDLAEAKQEIAKLRSKRKRPPDGATHQTG